MPIGLLGGLSLGATVLNTIQGVQAARAAERRRRALIAKASAANDAALLDARRGNARDLAGLTGQAGDAVREIGRSSADALSQAGITNSGITGRAILEGQDRANAAVLSASEQMARQEAESRRAFQQWLLGQELGIAGEEVAAGRAAASGGYSALGTLLGQFSGSGATAPAKASSPPVAGSAPVNPEFAGIRFGDGLTRPVLNPLSLAGQAPVGASAMGAFSTGNFRAAGGELPARASVAQWMNGQQGRKPIALRASLYNGWRQ